MIREKKLSKFLVKYIFNPNAVYFIYFLFISLYGLSEKNATEMYAIFSPLLIILFTFLYLPFIVLLVRVPVMEKTIKINHVLEHGTIYFLKEKYGIKRRIGGSSCKDGFRVYGKIKHKQDIMESFSKLKHYLKEGKSSIVPSKLCGSNTSILGGISFIILTITFVILLFFNLQLPTVKKILLSNVITVIP